MTQTEWFRDYKITGNYGTFEITKNVRVTGTWDWDEDDWEGEAWQQGGLMAALEADGWTFTQAPNGEEWEIERVI